MTTTRDYQPLTPRLLRERTAELFERCFADGGDPDDIAFEIVTCDVCRLTINRLLTGDPIGWTTSGDRWIGWHDRCRGCSRG